VISQNGDLREKSTYKDLRVPAQLGLESQKHPA